jgi:tetratricopeptide (TPR) repeat protein
LAFEDAKRNRKAMYDKMEQDLVTVMSLRDVRKMYDSLDELEKYIAANYMESADAALKELYFRKGRESLYGSQKNALAAVKTLKDYPEAEYWIGETYRVEGELNIALKQYKRAYDQRANLENPSFDIEILYKIVDVLKIQQNYIEMEAQAERLVALDTLWGGESGFYARTAMERILENDGMERFLTVYRYDNPQVERIHRVLGFFYYASGRHVSALDHLIFSFLIQNTIIINDLIRNRYDFEVTTMDALIREAGQNPTLVAYMQDVEYYKTIYYLGATFYATGRAKAARSCWALLSRCNAGGWTVKAEGQLRRPSIERAIETP